jgi:arylsulfatase A
MAETGVRFTQCFSQPLCTPSRAQIMTGRYNNRNYEGFGYLNPKEITFGNMLKDAGYATCISGKWQLNGIKKFPDWEDLTRPNHFGFDEYCLWQLTKARGEGERYADPLIEQNGELLSGLEDRYGPDVYCDYILDFMERHSDTPFFVYFPMALTHCPFWPTPDNPEWNDPAKRKPGDGYVGEISYFGEMVTYMDKIVGRIVDKIDSLGISEDTLILFTSDNGTDRPIESEFEGRKIRGGKSYMTDAGTRVPLIAVWRGTAASGKVCEDLVDFVDFMPTFAEAAETVLPDDRVIDGVSFLPQLLGKKGTPREWIFCHYWERGRVKERTKEFVRDRRWKLYDDGRLYDMRNDPLEESPLEVLDDAARAVKNRLLAAFHSVRSRGK